MYHQKQKKNDFKYLNPESNTTNPDFFGAPRHMYYYFSIAGNIEVIKTIKAESNHPNLASLNFSCTGINDGVIDTIIEYLIKKEKPSLKELDLSGNNFTDAGISRLLDAVHLTPHCQLQRLFVAGNSDLTESIIIKVDATMVSQASKVSQFKF